MLKAGSDSAKVGHVMRCARSGAALVALGAVLALAPSAGATVLPPDFQESVAWSGLSEPTAVRFAPTPDTRVFVAEKPGQVVVFDDLADTTPTQVIDLRTDVFNADDRGLLGLAVDPQFPMRPYLYLLYSHDSYGGVSPRWGTPGATDDACPAPPGPNTDGCVVNGRLERVTLDPLTGTAVPGGETVLLSGQWCQQFSSHSIGDLAFGADGMLYASAGDGASYLYPDYGQAGGTSGSPPPVPRNPCGDPPGHPGDALTPPNAQGGSLRSQDLRTLGDPAGLDGALIRIDPDTGAGAPGNPLAASGDANARRIVAEGLRNPYRIAMRPGTSEPWVGDVGEGSYEEINRVPAAADGSVDNFGWPCYEGPARHDGWDALNVKICEDLYAQGADAVSAPFLSYNHSFHPVAGDGCPTGGSAISGLAFYPRGPYPAAYDGALFFSDYARKCIWSMRAGPDGIPDPSTVAPFASGAGNPVDLQTGPDGALYSVDPWNGAVLRIAYTGPISAPVANATAAPASGVAPLSVAFDGRASSDADPGQTATLAYAWDLDGDGAYDDATGPTASRTYPRGTFTARLKVTDEDGLSGVSAPITINASNSPPTPVITQPDPGLTWAVGDTVTFSGSAADAQDGTVAASGLQWTLDLNHCPGGSAGCHVHRITRISGVAGGTFIAPDHEYPSFLTLTLTATDSDGASALAPARVDLEPRAAPLTLTSDPPGLTVAANGKVGPAPLVSTVIVNSTASVSAESPQVAGGATWAFAGWSDGGLPAHLVTVPAGGVALEAAFTAERSDPPVDPPVEPHGGPPASPPPATPPPVTAKPPARRPAPGLALAARPQQLVDRHGRFSVDARCSGGCTLAARATVVGPARQSRADAGTAAARVAPGGWKRLVFALPPPVLRALRRLGLESRRLPVAVAVTATNPAGRAVRHLSLQLGSG